MLSSSLRNRKKLPPLNCFVGTFHHGASNVQFKNSRPFVLPYKNNPFLPHLRHSPSHEEEDENWTLVKKVTSFTLEEKVAATGREKVPLVSPKIECVEIHLDKKRTETQTADTHERSPTVNQFDSLRSSHRESNRVGRHGSKLVSRGPHASPRLRSGIRYAYSKSFSKPSL